MNDSLTIISPTTLAEAKELATTLSNANTMPAALKKSPADVLALVMAGAELGLAPMQSIRGIMLIEGKPTLSADVMGALVKASPKCEYLQCAVTTDKVATFVTKRRGDPEPTTFSFTIEEANLAGLNKPTQSGKPSNWMKFPKAMLRARAQSGICRLVYSDLMLGVYDPDELDQPVERDVTPEKRIESTPAVSPPSTVDALKADLKRRRMPIVDVPAAVASPPRASIPDGVAFLDWPENAKGKAVDSLTAEQVQWCIDTAQKKLEGAPDEARGLWFDRLATFTAELQRRGAA